VNRQENFVVIKMKKILIVEDEAILSGVLKDRFEDDGWKVSIAVDGEVAMAAIKGGKFDLVLLDLIMPKKDGFEVLKELRSEPEFKDLPILVLSNLGGDEDIKKALSLGATDYFVKTQHPVSEILEKARVYETGKKEE
jgi:DNA-binding response OmpR family regulator